VRVRRVEPHEWQQLREVRLRSLADAPTAFLTTLADARDLPDESWRDRARDGAAGEHQVCFVAERDGSFVGMAVGFVDPADLRTVVLVSMWVDPAARRSGLGAALVEAVVAWARDRGAERVTLGVNERNAAARRLYERIGFVTTGATEPMPTDPGAVVVHMALTLEPSSM
jgi:ribosomal protein S18 acetylase RimI-like enzyme